MFHGCKNDLPGKKKGGGRRITRKGEGRGEVLLYVKTVTGGGGGTLVIALGLCTIGLS